ncbi:MAG: M20/M25/M40 family metallo-hydrolase [Acidobacteria bacterium]|nr:M20/M25/M40 family metallo-hydrolase [Acidobacteriota bacterium]MBV9477135.1 M20/M25/M40 family metallo-hydrolase [Acidobacteriota bacterium]
MIRKTFSLAATFICAGALALPALAQSDADRAIDYELANSRAYDTLEYLTDNIGPRLSGSKGAALAVTWATKQLRAMKLDDVRNEPVMVPHWVRGVERATLVSHNDQKIVLTALGGSVATPENGITADVVEVSSFEELDRLGRKVAGKIVYFNNPIDMSLVESGRAFDAYSKAVEFRGAGPSHAAQYGAVAALIRSVASASLRSPHTGSLRYDEKQPKIPGAALSVEDALLVHRLLAKGERVRMHLVLTPRTLPDAPSFNVVAEIRGSERPNEIVLIGGHLDSWDLATGAIDDGSGAAMCIETMRVLKELGIKPKRTIRAVLFMNEENGLRGGHAYFDAAAKREEIAKHVAVIETDAGAATPVGFTTTLEGSALANFTRAAAPLNRIAAPLTWESSRHTGADTSPLTDAGVTGFGLTPDPRHYFDFHHSPADTLDKVDPHQLAQNTAAIAGLAVLLANQ